MGVQCNITSAYHPQSNGLDQRFNQMLQRQLLKYVDVDQSTWDLFLDAILFSYRVARQDSTKVSPFLLVYGRQARLPVELTLKAAIKEEEEEADKISDMDLEEYTSAMVAIRRKALENIKAAQERQKTQYDSKHCKDKAKYKAGSLVLVKNCRKLSRKGLKMEPNWTGPYCIHEVLSKGTF